MTKISEQDMNEGAAFQRKMSWTLSRKRRHGQYVKVGRSIKCGLGEKLLKCVCICVGKLTREAESKSRKTK